MKIRPSRLQTLSAKSRYSISTYIPSFSESDMPLRSKRRQSRSIRSPHKRLYSQNLQTISSQPISSPSPCQSRPKPPLIHSKSTLIPQPQKLNTITHNKSLKINNPRRRIFSPKSNQISTSKLRENESYTIGYQQFIKQDNKRLETLDDVTVKKVNYRYYQDEVLTPRVTQFRLVLKGNHLMTIFGNNQVDEIDRRYDHMNSKLFQNVSMYKLRSRAPKSARKWNY